MDFPASRAPHYCAIDLVMDSGLSKQSIYNIACDLCKDHFYDNTIARYAQARQARWEGCMTPPQKRNNFTESLVWLSKGRSIWDEQPLRKVDKRLRDKWHIRDNDSADIIRAKAEGQLERLVAQYAADDVKRNAIRISFNIGGIVPTDLDLGERQKRYHGDSGIDFSPDRSRNAMEKVIPVFASNLQAITPEPLSRSEIESILRRYRAQRAQQTSPRAPGGKGRLPARNRSRRMVHTVRARAIARSTYTNPEQITGQPVTPTSVEPAMRLNQADTLSVARTARTIRVSSARLAPVVDQLADTIWAELRATAIPAGSTASIAVHWRQAPDFMDHWTNIRLDEDSTPLDLDGQSEDIRSVFDQIPSGRLVILGKAGSGKSTLVQQLAQSLLDPKERVSGAAVPVIFALSSWNPHRQRLRAWLAASLVNDGYVRRGRRRSSSLKLATELIDAGLILPILDGFDEIPPEARLTALEIIEQPSPIDQFVLTSRPEEYIEAVAHLDGLTGATVIQLEDLDPTAINRYLNVKESLGEKWAAVLDAAHPAESEGEVASPLREALSTPLMVSLASVAFSEPDAHPNELLNEGDYSNPIAIQDRLFDRYLSVSYSPARQEQLEASHRVRRSWPLDEAQHWLGFIALHLHAIGEQEFQWSSLRRATPSLAMWPSVLLTAVWLQAMVVDALVRGGIWRLVTFLIVVAAGFAFVRYLFCADRPIARSRNLRFKLRGRVWRIAKELLDDILASFVMGFIVILMVAAVLSLVHLRWIGLNDEWAGAVLGATAWIAFTYIFGIALENEFSVPPSTDSDFGFAASLRDGRRTSLIRITLYMPLLLVLAIAGLIALSPGVLFVADVPLVLLVLFGSWGLWLQARITLTVGNALPWRLVEFLDDAHRRGVLRRTAKGYQFRHALLQDYLAVNAYSGLFGLRKYPRNNFDLRYNIALTWLRQSKLEPAEEELDSLLDTLCDRDDECFRRSFAIRILLAQIADKAGRPTEAETAFRELAMRELEYLGARHEWTQTTVRLLTACIEAREPAASDATDYGELLTSLESELDTADPLVEKLRRALVRHEQSAESKSLVAGTDTP